MVNRRTDLGELVRQLGTSPPFQLLEVARAYLAEAEGLEAVNLLLVDYGQELLTPFRSRSATYRAAARGDLPTIRMCGKLFVPTELVLQKIGLRPPVDIEPRAAS